MADPRFIGLVHSLLSSGQASLGELDSPMAHRLDAAGARSMRTAERSLALLRMLHEKTAGNLDETERAALHDALTALRDGLRSAGGHEPAAASDADAPS
jgi:hypothetical protein